MITEMAPEKITTQVAARLRSPNPFGVEELFPLFGYEIHMGRSRFDGGHECSLFEIVQRNGRDVAPHEALDGAWAAEGRVWGTYLHGIFDNDRFRELFLNFLSARKGQAPAESEGGSFRFADWKEKQYDELADFVRRHCDVERIYRIMGLK